MKSQLSSKERLIALILSFGLDHKDSDLHRGLGLFLEDVGHDANLCQLATFLRQYKPETFEPVSTDGLKLPDLNKVGIQVRPLFTGEIRRATTVDLSAIIQNAWQDPKQHSDAGLYPSMYMVLGKLVASFTARGQDDSISQCEVGPADLIHGHFGATELHFLAQNWDSLPEFFRAWAKNKKLYGWADAVIQGEETWAMVEVPCLDCTYESAPKVSRIVALDRRLMKEDFALLQGS